MRVEELMKNAQVASPCSADWDEMTGDEKMRFCGQCKLHVLDASAMTDEEVLGALQRTLDGSRVCMRFYRRADGRFLTKDCPVGWALVRTRTKQAARYAAAWVSGALAVVLSLAAGAVPRAGTSSSSEQGGASSSADCGVDTRPQLSGKQKWHCKITGAAADAAAAAARSGSVTNTDKEQYFRSFNMGQIVILTKEQLAAQEDRLDVLKAQGPKVSTADAIISTVHHGLHHRTIAKNLALLGEALDMYVATKQWQKASAVSSELASHYSGFELHDPVAAAPFRRQADEYYARSGIATEREKQAIRALLQYENAQSWSDAQKLCIQMCADALKAKNGERSLHWMYRGSQYGACIKARTIPASMSESRENENEVWQKAMKLANLK